MRLEVLSDLHFEFQRDGGRGFVDSLDPNGVDVLVLAGDIAVAEGIPSALGLLCERFRAASVVYVHGNHEFYRSNRARVLELTRAAERAQPNLIWLDVGRREIAGVRFLGAPLWFRRAEVDPRFKRAMTDFSAIQGLEAWVYDENARAISFLQRHLAPGDVVVTHHLPSALCVAPQFAAHPLNAFFVCELADLIAERRPRLWIHGHTHSSVRLEIGATTVLCNPFGYAGHELNPEFEDRLVVDL